jgi:4-amino-4-deoxy-L-arabinose transferase-like glycosyltransferase
LNVFSSTVAAGWRRLEQRLRADDYTSWLLIMLLMTMLGTVAGIGLRSPWPADEPRFVEVVREMLASGRWLFPMRGGELYADKPPVFFWAIALCYRLVGDLRIAFLLPSALCGLATVALVFDLGARLRSVRVGRQAAMLVLIAPQFLLQARHAQIDAMVACWITVGCYGLIRHFVLGPSWRWYFTAWAFMGLGIITKGVGFLPALMLAPLAWLAWRGRLPGRETWRWRCLLGPMVAAAVVGLWLIPMLRQVAMDPTPALTAYRDNILLRQTAERYADTWTHLRPWHYFLSSVIPGLWFPLWLIAAGYAKPILRRLHGNPGAVALLAWAGLVLLFFSASPGKRGVYILPALPAVALALACLTAGVPPHRRVEGLIVAVLHVVAAVLAAAGVLALAGFPPLAERIGDYTADPKPLQHLGMVCIGLAIVVAALLIATRGRTAVTRMLAVIIGVWTVFGLVGHPALEPLRTPRNVTDAVAAQLPSTAELGLVRWNESLLLFLERRVTHFGHAASTEEQARNAWQWMAEAPGHYLIVPAGIELPCFESEAGRDLGVAHRRAWRLYDRDAMHPQCAPPSSRMRFHSPAAGSWRFPAPIRDAP